MLVFLFFSEDDNLILRIGFLTLRRGAEVACQSHKLEVPSSNLGARNY